jgi:hypothetical protein
MAESSMEDRFKVEIAPRWEEIAVVRAAAAEYLRRREVSPEVVDATAMVACELTENGVKYGTFENLMDRVEVELRLSQSDVTVEVRNPVGSADNANLARLDQTIQWIRGYQDPFEAYLQRLKEISWQDVQSTESRLGLVRIAYEGQSVLDFFVNERDVLAVSAIRRR